MSFLLRDLYAGLARILAIAAVVGCAAMLATPYVWAQGQEQESDEDEEALELKAATITGSRLRDTIGGAPIFVLTREDIKQRGLGSVEDVVRSLPQNLSSVNAAAARDNSINSTDAQGQSTVNLRGFGSKATLVLVNGRRWTQASSFGNGAVNVNGLPFSAIERVEVLTDGASAIYGADAQAGVVNFILRDDYEGGETLIRYDMGAHGGDSKRIEQNASMSWGGGDAPRCRLATRKARPSTTARRALYRPIIVRWVAATTVFSPARLSIQANLA